MNAMPAVLRAQEDIDDLIFADEEPFISTR